MLRKFINIISGAVQPWCMKNSDAEFNVGMSLGFLQSQINNNLSSLSVYIVMNGLVIPAQHASRDPTGLFIYKEK